MTSLASSSSFEGPSAGRVGGRRATNREAPQMPCPICGRLFAIEFIGEHANACAEKQERKTGDPSPPLPPAQPCRAQRKKEQAQQPPHFAQTRPRVGSGAA